MWDGWTGLSPPYSVVVADPPWHFKPRAIANNDKTDRSVARHYSTLSIADLCALPVKELVARDCHLFLWITGPMLAYGLHLPVMKAWGFRPSAVGFTWVKLRRGTKPDQLRLMPTAEADLHVGLGLTTRKNAEFCIMGRRGNARRADRTIREVILSPVREHSRKPDEFKRRVDRYVGPGLPTVELFSREDWPKWDRWGAEAGKFNR